MAGLHSLDDAELVGEHLAEMFLTFKNYSISKKIKVVAPLSIIVMLTWFYFY